jgi:hypothetical protein
VSNVQLLKLRFHRLALVLGFDQLLVNHVIMRSDDTIIPRINSHVQVRLMCVCACVHVTWSSDSFRCSLDSRNTSFFSFKSFWCLRNAKHTSVCVLFPSRVCVCRVHRVCVVLCLSAECPCVPVISRECTCIAHDKLGTSARIQSKTSANGGRGMRR